MSIDQYYMTFLAVNLHFKRSGKYDFFKYNGKTRFNPNATSTRKDRFAIAYFESSENLVDFRDRVVAYNFYEKKSPWSAIELKKSQSKEYYEKWKYQNQNLEKTLEKDLKTIDNLLKYVTIREELFLPDILTDVIGERISPHTFMVIDRVLGLTENFYGKHYNGNLIYQNSIFLLEKSKPFVMINKKHEAMIKDKCNGF